MHPEASEIQALWSDCHFTPPSQGLFKPTKCTSILGSLYFILPLTNSLTINHSNYINRYYRIVSFKKEYLEIINSVHLLIETVVWGQNTSLQLKEETRTCLESIQPFLFVTAGSNESKVKWTDLPQFVSMQLKAASLMFNVCSHWS